MESLTSRTEGRVFSHPSSAITVREKSIFAHRVERCVFATRKVSGFGLLSSVLVQPIKALVPVSCVFSNAEVDLEETDVEAEEIRQSKTVHVKFQLEKECLFGQQFLIVGNDPMFGQWNPETAVPLNWSDQHIWFADLDIPVGKPIQYKFILKDGSGGISWQLGPNRSFKAWETENTILVSDDWENCELQVISEVDPNATQFENFDDINTDDDDDDDDGVVAELTDDQSETEKVVAAKILGNNGRAMVSLVNNEGEPVLVPGLPPVLEVLSEEGACNEVEERVLFDDDDDDDDDEDSDEVDDFEANDHSVPEIQVVIEKGIVSHDEMMIYSEEQKLESKEQSDSDPKEYSKIMVDNLRWGQKTLQRFIANFRLFQ